ncbi:MAG: HD domain-containing protein [Lachnospiraceae bacterium]|nr:HD domain-containing protein [Lachnospiraceae bacterium]
MNTNQFRLSLFILVGITVNVIMGNLSFRFDVPIYLDTMGTVLVAAVSGVFPAIFTAMVSNVVSMVYNVDAVYFGLVNVLTGMFAAWFFRAKRYRKVSSILVYVCLLGVLCGTLGALIQWGLLGKPQSSSIVITVEMFAAYAKVPLFVSFLSINILLNMVDKGIALGAVLVFMHFYPKEKLIKLKNCIWKQQPLSTEQIETLRIWSKGIGRSVRTKMVIMLFFVSFALVFIMGVVGVRLYLVNEKEERKESAVKAAEFTAKVINPEMLTEYIKYGDKVQGYDEIKGVLTQIRDNAHGVKYLYIVQMKKDGYHFVFDVDTEDEKGFKPGEIRPYDKALEPYKEKLIAGENIAPVEANDFTKWILTSFVPIRNEAGQTLAYVGADVSITNLASYMRDFLFRVILIMAGFFVLILAYALWSTGIAIVYPINAIAMCLEQFAEGGEEQDELDKNVKKIRDLNIHTNDEVERLFHAICQVTLNEAEQIRSIRKFSEATTKMQDGLIITMADMVENRDSDTGEHIQKTAAYVKIIVEGLQKRGYYAGKITPKFISDVVRSAPLHDVGKINISDKILNKPGKLTEEEYETMKLHTVYGKQIMEKAISTVKGENYLKEARNMAAYHHERWDGTGYPEGLHGEVIPLSARIMAVADVFDALTSPRVYKPAFPMEKAIQILEEGRGTQFDAKCVDVFLEALPEVKMVLRKYNQHI